MLVHAISPAWYDREGWRCYLNARLWPDDEKIEQIEMKDNIRFVLVDKYCIGFSNNYPRYHYNPCPEKQKDVTQCTSCRNKNLSHLCERCTGDYCQIPELDFYCRNEHVIYVAIFSPEDIKVGISSLNNFVNRIVEQGPFMVLKLLKVQDKFIARKYEDELSRFLEISERVSSTNKEEILLSDYNPATIIEKVIAIKQKLYNFSVINKIHLEINDIIYMSKYYNYNFLGKKLYNLMYTKKSLIEGKIISSIGPLTILENDMKYYILNMEKLKGWILDTEAEGYTQSRLI